MESIIRLHFKQPIKDMLERGGGIISQADAMQLKRNVERAAGLAPGTLDQEGPVRESFFKIVKHIVNSASTSVPYHKINHGGPGNKTMFIMIGSTGAGKTTYAEKLEKNVDAVVVSSDAFKSARKAIDKAVTNVLRHGRSVIVNATHPTQERRKELARIARAHGFKTRCIHLDVDKKTSQERSKLTEGKTKYFVSARYFREFQPPGSECDRFNVITDAGVSTRGSGGASGSARPSSPPPMTTPTPKRNHHTSVSIPKPMQAYHYENRHRGKKYYASEKLDGIRALYHDGVLYTRSGHRIQAPDWFVAKIPPGTYDGELYGGKGIDQFHKTSGVVMGSSTNPGWNSIQYRIFDDWNSGDPFSKTYEKLIKKVPLCSANTKHTVCLQPHSVLERHENIQTFFDSVTSRGGEGIMLRSNVPYQQGQRTHSILKMKKVAEAEARVVGFYMKPDNTIKSLTCKWVSPGMNHNVTFQVAGLSARDKATIKVGDVITVKYMELQTSGKPRHGVFKGVRRNL